jgi:hypothetical protein
MRTELSPAKHRSWCSPTDCHAATSDFRTHRARRALAQSPSGELTVSVQLEQDGNMRPTITMTATYAAVEPKVPREDYELLLDPGLACAVGWILLTAGRQAIGDDGRSPQR